MGYLLRRALITLVAATCFILTYRQFNLRLDPPLPAASRPTTTTRPIRWKDIPQRYSLSSTIALPTGAPAPRPRIQHEFRAETEHNKARRLQRQAAVKNAFLHSWEGYKKYAWMHDEVLPVSAGARNTLGSRGATLVDSMDTLLIMGLDDEFKIALKAIKKIDFSSFEERELNLFETNIRYLGGLLGAYDLSVKKHHVLLEKAIELGDMLYAAFDTPNRLPVTRWNWQKAARGGEQHALYNAFSAELGTLSLEFTRLSQLTGDSKYYDAVQRISNLFAAQQNNTSVPGLFPITVNPRQGDLTYSHLYSLGGCADSLYEYFLKQHMLLGGREAQNRKLYEHAIDAAKEHLFFRPLHPENKDVLMSGNGRKSPMGGVTLDPEGQHLACFVGGMVALGAQALDRSDDLQIGRKLVDGCIWTSDATPTGIMPEKFHLVPCEDKEHCEWDTQQWYKGVKEESGLGQSDDVADAIREDRLPHGFARISDRRFLLRPEAIESIFVLYRITGDKDLQDAAWRMFTAISNATRTHISYSAIADVTRADGQETRKLDECESFWMAETLKYFYLIFSDPELVSLDEFVFNTEAHPLRMSYNK